MYLFSSLFILILEGFLINTGGCSKNAVLKKNRKKIGNYLRWRAFKEVVEKVNCRCFSELLSMAVTGSQGVKYFRNKVCAPGNLFLVF